MYEKLTETNTSIQLYYVDSSVVESNSWKVPKSIPAIWGTMNIHQVICSERGVIRFRDIACFCSSDKLSCNCYKNVKHFIYHDAYVSEVVNTDKFDEIL